MYFPIEGVHCRTSLTFIMIWYLPACGWSATFFTTCKIIIWFVHVTCASAIAFFTFFHYV